MKKILSVVFGAVAFLMAGFAQAVPVDLTTITTAVDFSTTTAAILLVAAALAAVYIAYKAASLVIRAVKGM